MNQAGDNGALNGAKGQSDFHSDQNKNDVDRHAIPTPRCVGWQKGHKI
jgi:hypothetical protein